MKIFMLFDIEWLKTLKIKKKYLALNINKDLFQTLRFKSSTFPYTDDTILSGHICSKQKISDYLLSLID